MWRSAACDLAATRGGFCSVHDPRKTVKQIVSTVNKRGVRDAESWVKKLAARKSAEAELCA